MQEIEVGVQIVKYGDPIATIDLGLLAEEIGFDLLSVPDHLFHPLDERWISKPAWDAYVVLSYLASRTKRIKLTTGVSDALRRHPATIAHIIATLDILSKGRARLGMGAGERWCINPLKDINFEKPATLLREALIVIKGLWKATRDKPFSFSGEFLKIKDGYLGLEPAQKYPPILIGGHGPKLRRITAELAEYWLPWLETPEIYEKQFKEIKEWEKRFGRKDEVRGGLMLFSYVAKNKEEAINVLSKRVKVGLALRKRLLFDLGYKDYAEKTFDLWDISFDSDSITKLYKVADSLPDELIEKVSAIGKVDDVIEKIEKFRKAGVSLFVIIPPIDKIKETILAYKSILAYFREQEK